MLRRVLAEFLPKPPGRALLLRDDRGEIGTLLAERWPETPVIEHHLDAWTARQHREWGRRVELLADPPEGPFDVVLIAAPRGTEALALRESIEAAHDRLSLEGRCLIPVSGPFARLLEMTKGIFGKADVQIAGRRQGAVVSARRTRTDAKTRDHAHVLRIPRGDRILEIETRPGTFCYGRLDLGTKALLAHLRVQPNERVLDLGSGTGILGLAAVQSGAARAVLVDSNARACALAQGNAVRNGLRNVDVCLRADLEDIPAGPYELVLANPPYFSEGRIALAFALAARTNLAPGGRCVMVAKAIELHRSLLMDSFAQVLVDKEGEYGIFTATEPRARPLGDFGIGRARPG